MTEPTDNELQALWSDAVLPDTVTKRLAFSFARAVLAKWGNPALAAPWRSAVLDLIDECPGLNMEQDRWLSRRVKELDFESTPQPTQAQAGSVTADDLKQPRNGAQWRVEWWNESCRMLLPANKRLDSFQTYRNGTLMFTIKEKSGIKGGQHGADT